MSTRRGEDLNPLRLGGKSLPPPLVLTARFLGLTVLLLGPDPFARHLPYLETLDAIGSTQQFDAALQLAVRVGIVLLFFGPFVRTGCLLVGAAMLLGLVACRPCQSVAHTYTACVFVVLSLSSHASGAWLLRIQVLTVYAGATVHKALDADWWNGHYIETLLVTRHHHGSYTDAAALLPPFALSSLVGVVTILTEAALVVCFLRRRWYRAGIVLGVTFHSIMVLFMGLTFGPFYAAVLISFVAFVEWPRRLEIRPASSGSARRWGRAARVLDVDGFWLVRPAVGPGGSGGLSAVVGPNRYEHLSAVPWLVLTCPLVFVCLAVALATPWPTMAVRTSAVLGAIGFCALTMLLSGPSRRAVPAEQGPTEPHEVSPARHLPRIPGGS